jgi:hypothetical protein
MRLIFCSVSFVVFRGAKFYIRTRDNKAIAEAEAIWQKTQDKTFCICLKASIFAILKEQHKKQIFKNNKFYMLKLF